MQNLQTSRRHLLRLFLPQLPKWTRLRPLRHVTSRAPASSGMAMLPVLSRSAVRRWQARAMARSRNADR